MHPPVTSWSVPHVPFGSTSALVLRPWLVCIRPGCPCKYEIHLINPALLVMTGIHM